MPRPGLAAYLKTASMAASEVGDSPLFPLDYALRLIRVVVLLALWRTVLQANPTAGPMSLGAGQLDLPGALLLWAKEHGLADGEPLFVSRKRAGDGRPRSISRQQAWEIVRAASERANVRVLALRSSTYGG